MTRRLLLAAVLIAFATPAFAQFPSSGWGPSWVGGKPPGGFERPTDLKKPTTAINVRGSREGLGVEVSVWADAGGLVKGHEYHLSYQLRVHTKKGEYGPMIDLGGKKGGTAFVVAKGTFGGDWRGLEGEADITRKELCGAAGWPEVKARTSELPGGNSSRFDTVFVRVEPQLYDATDKKYLTDAKTPAFILAATVGEGGKVTCLHTLGLWIEDNGLFNSAKVAEALGGLDVYDAVACDVANAMLKPLTDKDTKKEAKLALVGAVTPDMVADRKMTFYFVKLMEEWAKGDDAELKAAAKKVLGEK